LLLLVVYPNYTGKSTGERDVNIIGIVVVIDVDRYKNPPLEESKVVNTSLMPIRQNTNATCIIHIYIIYIASMVMYDHYVAVMHAVPAEIHK